MFSILHISEVTDGIGKPMHRRVNSQVLSCIHNMIAGSYETRSRNISDELLFSRDSPSEMDYNGRFWTWCARIDQILHLLHAGSARQHTHQYGQVILECVRMLFLPSPWFLLQLMER